MESDDFRERVRDERRLRAQRDAAEKAMPGERLRREIREAFERERAARGDEHAVSPEAIPPQEHERWASVRRPASPTTSTSTSKRRPAG